MGSKKNKIKRTQVNRRTKRVKKTRSQKKIQRTKRTKRTFLKNKRKTQKRKRVLRGGMEAAVEPVGFPPGVIYRGTDNETEERICRMTKRIIERASEAGMEEENLRMALAGALGNALKIEIDAAQFLKDKLEELGQLPDINEELYTEFMEKYYPGDLSNAQTESVAEEKDEGHRYAFESVYHSRNFDRESKYVIEEGIPDIPFEEVVQDLLNYCGSKFSLDTLLGLGDILFSDCYHKDLRGVMGTFLESIQNNPNSTEFIFITMKKFERIHSNKQKEMSTVSEPEGKGLLYKAKAKKIAAEQALKEKAQNWCPSNISFLRGNLYQSMERYFPGFVFDPNKYFTYLARTDLEKVPIGASEQREEAARAAGASFGFEGEMGGRNRFAEIIEYAIKNNLYTESFQEIMDKYFMEEVQRQAIAADAPRAAISGDKAPAPQAQPMTIPGGASGSKGEPGMTGESPPDTTPPE